MVIRRGEIWWGELPEVGRRPFLVMTRDEAIPVLRTVVVAPITRTIRGIPSELRLDREDGMPGDCVASFDNLRVVPQSQLTGRLCSVRHRMAEACRAVAAAFNC